MNLRSSALGPIDHVAVVVPAHNERERVGATIESIEIARLRVRGRATVSITVVADRCSDGTAAVASGFLTDPLDAVASANIRSAGGARAIGFQVATMNLARPMETFWMASTDADTLVPAHWLEQQLDLADQGFAAVMGTVALRTDEPARAELRRGFESEYGGLLGAGSGFDHPHVHGANFGIRGDVYVSAGGWADLATGEEHDLIRRVRSLGWPTVSPTNLVVLTSPRLRARAPDGFAADLCALDGVS
ncbi:MAG: glycosyltransferase [Aquihabitans sp.]